MSKNKMGRPSKYSEAVAEKLCVAIATSSRGLRSICKNPELPSRSTVCRWLMENEDFQGRYARAKEFQRHALDDDIIDIADKCKNGSVDRARLRIDARKWVLSKLCPKKYGDRVEVDAGEKNPLTELVAEMKKRSQIIGPPVQDEDEISIN
jgi:hypothetical protein